MRAYNCILILLLFLLTHCAHYQREIKSPSEAMRLSQTAPNLEDDLDRESLLKGLQDLSKKHSLRPQTILRFGPEQMSAGAYADSLKKLIEVIEKNNNDLIWKQFIKDNFDFYEIFGKENWGDVFITSYFDPIIKGSRMPTKEYSQALYATPNDLVVIRMNSFIEKFPALEAIRDKLSEQKSGGGILRGRLSPGSPIGVSGEIFPYYTREEIDSKNALKNKKLELCYVDPIDSFVLQIQGSGTILLDDASILKVGYASQNGHPYVPIGKFLTDYIPLEEMNLDKIEQHLKGLSIEERQKMLNKNPSYVFFQKINSNSLSTFGTEVVPGRTIATDPRYFPKGAMAFLEFEKPLEPKPKEPSQTASATFTRRIVFDQDTGGAIRGPARLDLYWGKGDEAKQNAGRMKSWGKLYYLVPKKILP